MSLPDDICISKMRLVLSSSMMSVEDCSEIYILLMDLGWIEQWQLMDLKSEFLFWITDLRKHIFRCHVR